jgi:hypothetical protein
MFPAQHCSVKGNFIFKVFDKDHNLKQSIGPIENFITPIGLGYPAKFAFADCFRYISLGTGTAINTLGNTLNIMGTTGLDKPHPDYQYIGGRNTFEDYDGANSNYDLEGCSSSENLSGITLTRSWRIPKGNDTFQSDFTITEYMVSPGQPSSVSGYSPDDGFLTPRCACAAADVSINPFPLYAGQNYESGPADGPEHSALGAYYKSPTICEANKAFSRVLTDIAATSGDSINVTYNLNINFNIKPKIFSVLGTSQETNWNGTISGYCGLIHHGLKRINGTDATIAAGTIFAPGGAYAITQDYALNSELGESYTPAWGNPMEPSRTGQLMDGGHFDSVLAYITNDNLQFAFNSVNGGNLSVGSPISSGIMGWISNPSSNVEGVVDNPTKFNIRRFGNLLNYADTGNFYSSDNVSADSLGVTVTSMKNSLSNFPAFSAPTTLAQYSGRSRYTDFNVEFHGTDAGSNGGFPIDGQVKSLVLAYQNKADADDNGGFQLGIEAYHLINTIPFFDSIFASSGDGHAVLPATGAGNTYNTDNQNGYFYLSQGGNLTVFFRRSWSSDCPSSVSGCPGFVG